MPQHLPRTDELNSPPPDIETPHWLPYFETPRLGFEYLASLNGGDEQGLSRPDAHAKAEEPSLSWR
jgi:hypothetical protein